MLPLSSLLSGRDPEGVRPPQPLGSAQTGRQPGPPMAQESLQALLQMVRLMLQIPVLRELLLRELGVGNEAAQRPAQLPPAASLPAASPLLDRGPRPSPAAASFVEKLRQLRGE